MLLDVRESCTFTDFFVICSGESARQIHSVADEIEGVLKKEGARPHHHEGSIDSGWYLLDYTDVVIHIFGAKEREFYNLEELWSDAKVVLRIQ